jgi:hypothetical protein
MSKKEIGDNDLSSQAIPVDDRSFLVDQRKILDHVPGGIGHALSFFNNRDHRIGQVMPGHPDRVPLFLPGRQRKTQGAPTGPA